MSKVIKQGDVYWLNFESSVSSAPAERHPCVVVQSDISDRALAPGNVTLRKGDSNLPRPSVVNVSQFVTVDKMELEDRIGRLKGLTLKSILAGLRLVFEGD